MKSLKVSITLGIAFLLLLMITPTFIFQKNLQSDGSNLYEVSEKPSQGPRILFDSNSISSAYVRRVSNYQILQDVTNVVEEKDNWRVEYNKGVLLHVTLPEVIYDTSQLTFYSRLMGSCPDRRLLITKSNDPSVIYGEYTFTDSSWKWFNITLTLTHGITEFDVRVDSSCPSSRYLYIDYISYIRGSYLPYWRDEGGNIITKYQVQFEYQVNTTNNVDPSTVSLEVEAKSSIATPNGTEWIKNHGSFYELFPTEVYQRKEWSSRWVSLPTFPPPFCMWNTTEYGDTDYSQCNLRTQLNITVNVVVRAYGKLFNGNEYVMDVEFSYNIQNFPIFWY
jgi:hypothetical protein